MKYAHTALPLGVNICYSDFIQLVADHVLAGSVRVAIIIICVVRVLQMAALFKDSPLLAQVGDLAFSLLFFLLLSLKIGPNRSFTIHFSNLINFHAKFLYSVLISHILLDLPAGG